MKKIDYFDFYDKKNEKPSIFKKDDFILNILDSTSKEKTINSNNYKLKTKEESIRIAELKATKRELYLLVNSKIVGNKVRYDTNDNRRLELIHSKNTLKRILLNNKILLRDIL